MQQIPEKPKRLTDEAREHIRQQEANYLRFLSWPNTQAKHVPQLQKGGQRPC